MRIPIRATTRQACEALRAAGEVHRVRKVYAQVGGAYNVVAAECQALRMEGPGTSAAVGTQDVPPYPPPSR